MKQMTKEEIIEYFIEQLGDNEILGSIMSIEQIRDKLKNIISEITYFKEDGNTEGCWRWRLDGKGGGINYDVGSYNQREGKVIIVHELLHALSASIEILPTGVNIKKCGLDFDKTFYNGTLGITESLGRSNEAINEGMTDTLAEIITGEKHFGYEKEKDIYRIVSIIVGKEAMLKKYFSADAKEGIIGTKLFREELIEKYGEKLGNELNIKLRIVLGLADVSLILDKKNVKKEPNTVINKFQGKINQQIYKMLEYMMDKVIDKEPDTMKSIQEILMPGLSTRLKGKVADRLLKEVVENDDIDGKMKLEIYRNAKPRNAFSQETNQILDQLASEITIFKKELDLQAEQMENEDLPAEEKIKKYFSIYSGCGEFIKPDKVYDWYVEAGKISETPFKKGIFRALFTEDKSALDEKMSEAKYYKIGQYYYTNIPHKFGDGNWIVDGEGNALGSSFAYLNENGVITTEKIKNFILQSVPEEKRDGLTEQIKRAFLEMKQMENVGDAFTNGFFQVSGNLVEIQKTYTNAETVRIFYEIQPDGTMEKVEMRTREKIFR